MVCATVVSTASQWFTVVLLSKLTNPGILGTYALALSVVTPVLALTGLQLRYVLCTDARKEFSFPTYLFVRLGTVALSLSVIWIWFAAMQPSVFMVVLALGICKGSDAVCDICHGYLQANSRMDRIAISLMLQGVLQLTMFAAAVILTGSLAWGIASASLVSLCILAGFDAKSVSLVHPPSNEPIRKELARFLRFPKIEWRAVQKLILLSFPMGLVVGANALIGNIPRYFLAFESGKDAVGIFAALFYLTLPGGIAVSAYCDSACPQLAKWGAEGNFRQLGKSLAFPIVGAALIGIAGWLVGVSFGHFILNACYGAAYAAHTQSFAWLMAGAGFSYIATVLGYAVTSLREFNLQVPFRIVHLVSMYLICLYWVPREGLLGASKSFFASSVFFAIAMAALLMWILQGRIVSVAGAPATKACP